MNLALRAPPGPAASGQTGEAARARRDATAGAMRFAFERALRDQSTRGQSPFGHPGRHRCGTDGEDGERDPGGGEPLPRMNILLASPALPLVPCTSTPAGAPRSDAQDGGPTRAALEALLAMPSLPAQAVTAANWEVAIPQPAGGPLELRARRAPLADGSAGWTVDIRSGLRDVQSLLARAAARLSDRLEARSLRAHVRIEEADEEEAP